MVYEWVDFSKFSQIWAKIGSNLRNFRKLGDFAQDLAQNWMGHFFLGLPSNSALAVPPPPRISSKSSTIQRVVMDLKWNTLFWWHKIDLFLH